jgi:hypothetical protein
MRVHFVTTVAKKPQGPAPQQVFYHENPVLQVSIEGDHQNFMLDGVRATGSALFADASRLNLVIFSRCCVAWLQLGNVFALWQTNL